MIWSNIIDLTHNLDNFIFSSADHATCQRTLDLTICTATKLGIPVEPAKFEGPLTTLTFLGIEIGSVSRELRLLLTKLTRLKGTLAEWCSKKSATKHDLQVVICLLCDAAQVVPPRDTLYQEPNRHQVLPNSCKPRHQVGSRLQGRPCLVAYIN